MERLRKVLTSMSGKQNQMRLDVEEILKLLKVLFCFVISWISLGPTVIKKFLDSNDSSCHMFSKGTL